MKKAFILSIAVHALLFLWAQSTGPLNKIKNIQISYTKQKNKSFDIRFREIKQKVRKQKKISKATKKLNKAHQEKKVKQKESKSKSIHDKSILAQYLKEILYIIERNKKYPKRAKFLRQQGNVELRVSISKDGKLKSLEVLDSQTSKLLIDSAVKLVKKIDRFPKIPKDLELDEINLNLPIYYRLR